jgi:hypothetical protein
VRGTGKGACGEYGVPREAERPHRVKRCGSASADRADRTDRADTASAQCPPLLCYCECQCQASLHSSSKSSSGNRSHIIVMHRNSRRLGTVRMAI